MADTERTDDTLQDLVVKEAVGIGMESSMREPILEAVRESEGEPGPRGVSMLGAGVAIGAAAGYLLGSRAETLPVGEVGTTDRSVVDEVTEQVVEEEPEVDAEAEPTADEETGSSRLGRLVLALGIVAAIAVLRRRFGSDETEEWEPIEDFDTAVDTATEEEEGADAETDEGEDSEPDQEADEGDAAAADEDES